MNNYEVMFIIKSTLEEAQKEAVIETVKGIIEHDGGEVAKVDVWGMKKLAYPIQKMNEGYYVLMQFTSGTEFPKELSRIFNITDEVIRSLVTVIGE